jgi:hypothetical protein
MTYKISAKKLKEYVRVKPYHNLLELKKAGLNKKTFETKMSVERDCVGRIIIYNKEGKIIRRKPIDIIELNGEYYPIE